MCSVQYHLPCLWLMSSLSHDVLRTFEVWPVSWYEQGPVTYFAPLAASSPGGSVARQYVMLSHIMEAAWVRPSGLCGIIFNAPDKKIVNLLITNTFLLPSRGRQMIGGLAWLWQILQALPVLFGRESNLLIADNGQQDNAPRSACKKYVSCFLFLLLAIGVKFGFILINEVFGTSCDLIAPSCSLIPICWLSVPLSTWYKWSWPGSEAHPAETALAVLVSLRVLWDPPFYFPLS